MGAPGWWIISSSFYLYRSLQTVQSLTLHLFLLSLSSVLALGYPVYLPKTPYPTWQSHGGRRVLEALALRTEPFVELPQVLSDTWPSVSGSAGG